MKNSRINFSSQNELVSLNLMKYSDPYRWDYQLLSFVLGDSVDSEFGHSQIMKITNLIGGKVEKCANLNELMMKTDYYTNYYNLGKIFFNIEINNNIINKIQKEESLKGDPQNLEFKFSNKNLNSSYKFLVPFSVDFKKFKRIVNNNQITFFDRQDCIFYQENWPLPDDIMVSKQMKTLPKRKAHPTYILGNEIKTEFELQKSIDVDHYDINEKEHIIKIIENYPDLKLFHLKIKPYFEMFAMIQNIERKPFGVLKFAFKKKDLDFYLENENFRNLSIAEFLKSNPNALILMKMIVFPYDYKEFISLIKKYEANPMLGKTDLVFSVEKYLAKIPFI